MDLDLYNYINHRPLIYPITFSKNSVRDKRLQNRNFENTETNKNNIMKSSNFFRKAFLTATAVMITSAFYSCKDKENEAVETDVDAVETTEPIQETPSDTATMPADTATTTAPAP